MPFQNLTLAKLAQAAVTASTVTVYTVPTLTRTMVKDIDICNTTAGGLTFTLYLVPSGGSPSASNALFSSLAVAANTTIQWTGVQVLNAGDTIRVLGSALGLTVNISGAEAV